jgi:hypothetical protein
MRLKINRKSIVGSIVLKAKNDPLFCQLSILKFKISSPWNSRMNEQFKKMNSLKDFSIPCRGKFYYQNSIDS